MQTADDRSRRLWIRLPVCLVGLAVAAVGIGLAINTGGVTEPSSAPRAGAPLPAELAAASAANGRFAVDLYQRLAEINAGQNVFCSPFSISTALTMAAEGAVDQTRDQMLDVLHVPDGNLAQIHAGQRGLLSAVVPAVPPALAGKMAALRAKLKERNERTEALTRASQQRKAAESMREGYKLAQEISEISPYELQIANALWLEKSYPVEPNYLATVTPNYGAVVFPVDFKGQPDKVRLEINQWVARQTNNRIRDLLTRGNITDRLRLVLTNTVYLNGLWAEPFDVSATHPQRFHESPDRATEVQMMYRENESSASYGAWTATGDPFRTPHEIPVAMPDDDPSLYPDAQGHTLISLDYRGHRLQMIVLLPRSVDGLEKLEKSLSYESLQRWIGNLERRTVRVVLPKFKLETRYGLKGTLQSLGMVRAFQDPLEHPRERNSTN
jgi:serine protease inhibitor